MGRFLRGVVVVSVFLSVSLSPAAAQSRMELRKSQYELRTGQPVKLEASPDTLDFLLRAKSRSVEIDGAQEGGVAIGPSEAGDQILLASSLRLKPGRHSVKVTATSDTGESRVSSLEVIANAPPPVPSGSSRPPVVLLNGWISGVSGTCPIATSSSVTFGNLAQYLVADGVPAVYLFDNCAQDPNQPIETLGNDLGLFLNSITYDNGAPVQQFDLVAHSMGGLIARSYLCGLQPVAGTVYKPPTPTLVRKLVLIATPNFGSFVAGTFAATLGSGSQSAELIPGSSLLWNLGTWNQFSDDVRGVDAIAVVGNAGAYNQTVANASDGLVSLTSASAGFVAGQLSTTRIVPYCHVDPGTFINSSLGSFVCSAAGIANVTDTSHLTGQIVRSFLSSTKDWMSIGTSPTADPYLSKNGGVFFALFNSNGGYVTDLTGVQWGSVALQAGADLGTIFVDDLVFGSSQYVATSKSLGTVTCGQNTAPVGYIAVTRCKFNATILSVTPEASTTTAKVVAAGGALTINGATLGTQCGSCKVTATPTGSTTAQTLPIKSWSAQAITVTLPASLSGLVTLTVVASAGTDNFNVFVVAGSPALAVAPTTLSFAYTTGGAVPASQNVSITNSGSGALSWTATSNMPWLTVSPASGTAPATLTVAVDPSGLSAGTYTGNVQIASSGASGSPATVAVTLVVQDGGAGSTISAVVNTASYQPGFASATWMSIFGTNLSPVTLAWQASDFVNGALPTSLGGVSVTVNGLPAYVAYVSSTQINVLAPDDAKVGPVLVQVSSGGQQSNAFSTQKALFAPAFFAVAGNSYVTAQPAAPGAVITLYGTGFGPANPPVATSQLVDTPSVLANTVQISIGGVAATVDYAGIVGPGLYQFNVTVPLLANGDAPVVATIGGVQTPSGALLTVQQ